LWFASHFDQVALGCQFNGLFLPIHLPVRAWIPSAVPPTKVKRCCRPNVRGNASVAGS
jgi:hypothetical protein